jgi:hypothetical protein
MCAMSSQQIAAALLLMSSTGHTAPVPAGPTLRELVRQAEIIFEGEVTDIRPSAFIEGRVEKIVTGVTFQVSKVLKGATPTTTVLEFAGGVVGDRGYRVEGVPVFARGERDVIFAVTSKPSISPVVGAMYGRFRIVKDGPSAREGVRQFDDAPIDQVSSIGSTRRRPARSQRPTMSLSAFEAAVAAEVSRQARTIK